MLSIKFSNTKRIEKWESIYKEQNRRWNGLPSKLAETTLKFIYQTKYIKNIADIGCGYGRDSLFFLKYGYKVISIDASQTALQILKDDNQQILDYNSLVVIESDVLEINNIEFLTNSCQLLFFNYFLHLITVDELNRFIESITKTFPSNTWIAFNLISIKDLRYNGQKIGEIETDIHWTFWSKEDIHNLLKTYSLNILFWEEELEIEYINKQMDKVISHFVICEII